MPLWVVTKDLRVSYTGTDGVTQTCGQANPDVISREVMAWVFTQAAVGDLVRTPEGVFVRQAALGTH